MSSPSWEARETATRLCSLCGPLHRVTNLPWETISFSLGCIISKKHRFFITFIHGARKNKAQRQLRPTDAPVAPTHHPDGPAGAQAVAVAIPATEIGIVAVLQDVLLPSEVGVVEADPSPTLDADGVDPVEETSVLEAAAAAADLQLSAREAFTFVESDLRRGRGTGQR